MAKARRPKGNPGGTDGSSWRILPFTDGILSGPSKDDEAESPDSDAMLAQMKEFAEAHPELFREAMKAMGELHDTFAKEHGREPTEDEVVQLLGLGEMDDEEIERIADELEASGAFEDLLDDIDDDDLEPFPNAGADEDHADDDEGDDGDRR